MIKENQITFVFVHQEYAVVIEAKHINTAVLKLSEQISQTQGISGTLGGYWNDIAKKKILVFRSSSYTKNVCIPMSY